MFTFLGFAVPLRGVLVGLGIAVAAIVSYLSFRPPPPQIPVPTDVNKLEPQLQEYILEKTKWVRARPRRADRHATLGLVYSVNGLWHEARQAFENATLLRPNEPLALMYLGVAALESGDTDDALKIFEKLAKRFPDFAPGYYRLGTALLRAGRVDEAEPAFERLTVLAPQEWHGYAGLGEIKLRRGQPREAMSYLERAVQLDASAKSAHHLLGQAYRALGRSEDAEIELNLGRNAVNYPMADAWSRTATQHMKLLQDQVQMANEFSEAGEFRKAVEVLAKAYMYHSDNLSLRNQLAVALNRSNQPHKAYNILQEGLNKEPRSVPMLITLSFALQKLDRNEQALATAEQAIALAPTIAQTYVAKANALLAMEQDEEALNALRTARRVDPQNAEIPVEMGDVLWRNLHRPLEAKQQYESARTMDPTMPAIYVRLADLYSQLGEPEEARTALEKLRRIAPNGPDLRALESRLRDLRRP